MFSVVGATAGACVGSFFGQLIEKAIDGTTDGEFNRGSFGEVLADATAAGVCAIFMSQMGPSIANRFEDGGKAVKQIISALITSAVRHLVLYILSIFD